MRYAELTASSTKPLPSHSPWSGGSNVCSKLVTWLSRLLTPLKLTSGERVAVTAAAAAVAGPAGTVSAARTFRCQIDILRFLRWLPANPARVTVIAGGRPASGSGHAAPGMRQTELETRSLAESLIRLVSAVALAQP